MSRSEEIYVSIDGESDGPIPGINSLLSFGASAFKHEDRTPILLNTFEGIMHPLPGAIQDPDTMEWWRGFPEAWRLATEGARDPTIVMPEFVAWCQEQPGRVVLLGYPASWDYMWIYWYTIRFGGVSSRKEDLPFHLGARDIRQDACHLLGRGFWDISRSDLAQWEDDQLEHNHHCLTDAIKQGVLGSNIMIEARSGNAPLPWIDRRTA